jgi:hypothetical protein
VDGAAGQAGAVPRAAHGFNQRANPLPIKPRKSKQKGLDLLGFIRPNRDFSMGCGDSKQKNAAPSQVVRQTSQGDSLSFLLPGVGQARAGPANQKTITQWF